jgi:hypothetical protein
VSFSITLGPKTALGSVTRYEFSVSRDTGSQVTAIAPGIPSVLETGRAEDKKDSKTKTAEK